MKFNLVKGSENEGTWITADSAKFSFPYIQSYIKSIAYLMRVIRFTIQQLTEGIGTPDVKSYNFMELLGHTLYFMFRQMPFSLSMPIDKLVNYNTYERILSTMFRSFSVIIELVMWM